MNANLLFWTGAFINLGVILVLVTSGVRQVRRGEVQRHKRSMQTAIGLVVGFLVAYAGKVALLGKEDLSLWSQASLRTLHFHELCVTLMLLAGGFALFRARAFRDSRIVTKRPEDPPPPAPALGQHRLAGRITVACSVLGLLSSAFVLYGMYARL